MFWYDLALDHYFDDTADSWASMRTSWTDINRWYVAIKGGKLTGHASHGSLDDDGVRWAGELGSGDYIADGYFDPETHASGRWLYYRTRTEGQNTLVVDQQNQDITAVPTCKFESTGTRQELGTVFGVPSDSTAMFTMDLTSNYGGTSIKRGVRFLAGLTRVLLQDDITNATVAVDGSMATLSIDDKKTYVHILNAPTGVE